MQIPPEVHIRATIKEGAIYYFIEDSFGSKEPHFFVVLNRNPLTDEILILVNATTKIDKRREARKRLPPETLVEISSVDCSVLRENSLIDCNSITEKTVDTLIEKLGKSELRVCFEMLKPELLQRLREGVLASPIVIRAHKELLQDFE